MDSQSGDGAYRSSLSIRFTRDGQEEATRWPRPLTDAERSAIDAAFAPVLLDLRAVGAIVPEVRYEAWQDRGPESVSAFIAPAGRTVGSRGVWVELAGSLAEQVAQLAEQVQEWEVEELCAAGQSATWPECPEHPNAHPLEPVVTDAGAAIWRCPRAGLAICAIGELAGRRRGTAR
jgi:hypothetical protein